MCHLSEGILVKSRFSAIATYDMSSVSGRVRDLASLQDGQLGLDPFGLFSIGRDDV